MFRADVQVEPVKYSLDKQCKDDGVKMEVSVSFPFVDQYITGVIDDSIKVAVSKEMEKYKITIKPTLIEEEY